MHGIKVLMAKNYIDNLSEEARKGMRGRSGRVNVRHCSRPFFIIHAVTVQ